MRQSLVTQWRSSYPSQPQLTQQLTTLFEEAEPKVAHPSPPQLSPHEPQSTPASAWPTPAIPAQPIPVLNSPTQPAQLTDLCRNIIHYC